MASSSKSNQEKITSCTSSFLRRFIFICWSNGLVQLECFFVASKKNIIEKREHKNSNNTNNCTFCHIFNCISLWWFFSALSYHIALLSGRNVMRFWEARKWNSSKYFQRKILIPWTLSKLPFLHITQLTQQCSSRSDDERWRISHLLRSFFRTYIFNVRVINGGWPGREEWKKCSVTVSSTVFSVRVPN